MTAFFKDLMAFLALGGFMVTSLTWMDVFSKIV